jgi:hypothetical protein
MPVDMDRQSSGHSHSSDDHGKEAGLSLHKKEMREREFDDDDDDESAFPQCSEQDLSSSGDDPEDDQYRQDFIIESAELFESDFDKKSENRLADFTKSELMQRLMQIEK